QRRAADRVHPCGGRGLCRERHGRCQLRRGGGRAAVRSRFRPPADGGLFLRVPADFPGNRADAARARHHEGQGVSRGRGGLARIQGDRHRRGSHGQGVPRPGGGCTLERDRRSTQGIKMASAAKTLRVSFVQCRGTPYEVGRAQADAFAATRKGKAFLRKTVRLPWWFNIVAEERAFRAYAPALWEEIGGIAEGLNISM